MASRSAGLALIVCLLAAWACQDSHAQGPSTNNPFLRVVAAETFLADIAQNIAKDRTRVESLMPAGVDPHEFQPTPADIRKKLAECQVLILNGAGLESFQKELLRNAGGKAIVIEAAKGLKSRTIREGEVAEMSSAEAADAILAAIAIQKPKPVVAMKFASSAVPLTAGSKLFDVRLTPLDNGSNGGSVTCQSDGGEFQIAAGDGEVKLFKSPGNEAVAPKKTLSLTGDAFKRGYIVELERDAKYVVTFSGFKAASTSFFIAPAGESHDSGDPHCWMNPENVITYVINIRDGLSEADKFWAATYKKNAEDYIIQLKNLDAEIKKQLQDIPQDRRVLVTNHESLGYFADRYGFRIVGTVIPSVSSDASPSPKQLARLVDRIRKTQAPAIFLEADTNPQLARQVARECGVKVVTDLYIHGTSAANGPAPTYIEMIRYDAKLIVDALKAKPK